MGTINNNIQLDQEIRELFNDLFITDLNKKTDNFQAVLNKLALSVNDMQGKFNNLSTSFDDLKSGNKNEFRILGKEIKQATGSINSLKKTLEGIGEDQKKLQSEMTELKKCADEKHDVAVDPSEVTQQYNDIVYSKKIKLMLAINTSIMILILILTVINIIN